MFYHPPGYEILSWTNNTGGTIAVAVWANAQARVDLSPDESDDFSLDVEMSIVKTVGVIDSWSIISQMQLDLRVGQFDALPNPPIAGTPLKITSPVAPRQVTTDEGNPTEVRFGQAVFAKNGSLVKKVTLNDGETVSVKFKSKGSVSILQWAQMLLQQLAN